VRSIIIDYLLLLKSNESYHPFIAAWHPSASLIVLGKQIKIRLIRISPSNIIY